MAKFNTGEIANCTIVSIDNNYIGSTYKGKRIIVKDTTGVHYEWFDDSIGENARSNTIKTAIRTKLADYERETAPEKPSRTKVTTAVGETIG